MRLPYDDDVIWFGVGYLGKLTNGLAGNGGHDLNRLKPFSCWDDGDTGGEVVDSRWDVLAVLNHSGQTVQILLPVDDGLLGAVSVVVVVAVVVVDVDVDVDVNVDVDVGVVDCTVLLVVGRGVDVVEVPKQHSNTD